MGNIQSTNGNQEKNVARVDSLFNDLALFWSSIALSFLFQEKHLIQGGGGYPEHSLHTDHCPGVLVLFGLPLASFSYSPGCSQAPIRILPCEDESAEFCSRSEMGGTPTCLCHGWKLQTHLSAWQTLKVPRVELFAQELLFHRSQALVLKGVDLVHLSQQ